MESTETNEEEVGGLGEELGVHEHGLGAAACHVEGGDNVLSLGLASVALGIVEQVLHKILILLCEHDLGCEFLLQALLLESCLHLIFVLNSLSADGFLLRDALFIALSSLLAHALFLPQALLVTLEFELHLIFGPALAHFCLVLHGLALLFVFNLSLLDF